MTPQAAILLLAAEFDTQTSQRIQGEAFPPLEPRPALTESWYRFIGRPLDEEQDAFPAQYLGRGMLTIQCFTPRQRGRSASDTLARAAWDVFRGRSDIGPGIRILRARFDTQGEQEGFYQQTVRIDFEVDDTDS